MDVSLSPNKLTRVCMIESLCVQMAISESRDVLRTRDAIDVIAISKIQGAPQVWIHA